MIVVLMGVTGSGKSTIGKALGARIGAQFADGDDFHPAANKVKMAAGHALDDQDRKPWLETLNALLRSWSDAGSSGILACSALKQSHRAILTQGLLPGAVQFVHLDGSKALIASRLATRHHEFMNPNLLDSQLQTLEPPIDAIRVLNDRDPASVVDEILNKLGNKER